MTDEEKKAAEEAAKAEAEAKAAEAGNTEALEQALKDERTKREQAEKDLEETRRKAKERIEAKRKKEEEGDIEDEDKPLTSKEAEMLFEKREEKIRKEMREEKASELANKLAESEPEASLIMEVWKNRTLSGTLKEQIEEAHAIASYKRTQKQNEELKRALAGQDGENNDSSNPQRKPAAGSEPKLNPVDKKVIAGMVWDDKKQAYKKTIAGGRKIFYVSRNLAKRWTEDAK